MFKQKITWCANLLVCLLGPLSVSAQAAEQLHHSLAAGNSCNGNYIDISAKDQRLDLSAFGLHLSPGLHRLRIFTKDGSYIGNESRPDVWRLTSEQSVRSRGFGTLTRVPIDGLTVPSSSTMGVMIVSSHTLYYSNRENVEPLVENSDVRLFSGDAVCGEAFVGTVTDRVWNGSIYYNDSLCFPLVPASRKIMNLCL